MNSMVEETNRKLAEERNQLEQERSEYLLLKEELKKYLNTNLLFRSVEESKKEREIQRIEKIKADAEAQER